MGIFDRIFGKSKTNSLTHDHAGHSHDDAHDHAPHTHEDAHVHEGAPGSAHDPVCDMWVDPKKAPAKSEYHGQIVYFCAPSCKKAFDKDPAKYMPKLKHAH